MPSVLLLASPPPSGAANDNQAVLSDAFASLGCRLTCVPHEALAMGDAGLVVHTPDPVPLTAFDLVWLLGFGPRASYAQRLAALRTAPADRFVTPPDTMHTSHGKGAWLQWAPLTIRGTSAEALTAAATHHGGDWVLKPEAGSFGRDVVRVPADNLPRISRHLASRTAEAWLLQRFVPAIVDGEVRTLVAGNEVIGSYRRLPLDGFTANLAQGSTPMPLPAGVSLPGAVHEVMEELQRRQIGFAAIDTCGVHVLEVNVANPGGLSTLVALAATPDAPQRAARAVLRWRGLVV